MRLFSYRVFYSITRNGATTPHYMRVSARNSGEAISYTAGEVKRAIRSEIHHGVAIRDGCKGDTARKKLRYFYETFPEALAGFVI